MSGSPGCVMSDQHRLAGDDCQRQGNESATARGNWPKRHREKRDGAFMILIIARSRLAVQARNYHHSLHDRTPTNLKNVVDCHALAEESYSA